MNATEPLDEYDILVKTALRFDGYRYLKETGFEPTAVIEQLHDDLPTDLDDLQKLAVFFIFQRSLCKWSLVYEPSHGKYWRLFREMFFDIIDIDLPEEYRFQEWFSKWEEQYADRCPEAIECVRKKHNSIKYDDNARTDLRVRFHEPDNKEE
jgi:hypothetical protein